MFTNDTSLFALHADSNLLARATQDVLNAFKIDSVYQFFPQWLFIATWSNVTYTGALRKNIVSGEL
jgi:hypothetical protein